MIQTSQAFINAINQSSRQWRARLMYNGADTGANTKSLTVKGGSQPETAFNLCGIYGASFEAVIDSIDGFKWEDKIITPQLGLVLEDESVEWISLGVFTITEVKSAKYQTSIIGVGSLTANGGKSFTLPATQSVNAIINAITSEIGVTITLDASFDGTTVIEKSMDGLVVQEALQVCASVLGGFVADKYDGSIIIAPYPTTPTTAIDTTRMTQEPTFADYDNQITGVHVIVSPAFTDEDGQLVPAVEYQTANPNITIENPYMTASAFDDFADNVTDLTWRTANVPIALGDPRYEATDMIEVTVNGEVAQTYYVPCFNFVHHFDGGLQTTVIAYGDSESLSKTEQSGSVTRQLKEIQGDILRVDRAIVQTLEVGDHFFVGQDGHVHITEEPKDYTTGNNIYIDTDSIDVRQGTTTVASFGTEVDLLSPDSRINIGADHFRAINGYDETVFNLNFIADKDEEETPLGRDTVGERAIPQNIISTTPKEFSAKASFDAGMLEMLSPSIRTFVTIYGECEIISTTNCSGWSSLQGITLVCEKYITFGTPSQVAGSAIIEIKGQDEPIQVDLIAEYYIASGTREPHEVHSTIALSTQQSQTEIQGGEMLAWGSVEAEPIPGNDYPSLTFGSRVSNDMYRFSVVLGEALYSLRNNQLAIGKYNTPENATTGVFVIGCGEDEDSRADAFVVDWKGNTFQSGDITVKKEAPTLKLIDMERNTASFISAQEAGDNYGNNLLVQAGGNLLIGGGEYATNKFKNGTDRSGRPFPSSTHEDTYIGADYAVFIETNSNDIANSKRWTFSSGGNIQVPGNNCGKIYGYDTNGNELNAFEAHNSANNVVVNYGGYSQEVGNTNIYGNNINLISKSGIMVDTLDLAQALQTLKANASITPSVTSVSVNNATATEVGQFTLEAGDYQIELVNAWATNGTGIRKMVLATSSGSMSGVGYLYNDIRNAVAGDYTYCRSGGILRVASQTTFYVNAYQTSGGALTCYPRCSIIKLRN